MQKINREKISKQVYDQLRTKIVNGTWKIGEKIPSENTLADQLGVSRNTVRQAMRTLADYGFIEIRNGSGSYVKENQGIVYIKEVVPPTYVPKEDIVEILDFCCVLENNVAALAAERSTEEDVKELQMLEEQIENGIDLVANDLKFHQKIAEITRNKIIIRMYKVTNKLLYSAMDETYKHNGPTAGIFYHRNIIQAIANHDKEQARDIMGKHVENRRSTYLKMIQAETSHRDNVNN